MWEDVSGPAGVASILGLNVFNVYSRHNVPMGVSKRRCNQCREYYLSDSLFRFGSVWLCSEECKQAKIDGTNKESRRRESERQAEVDKPAVREELVKRDGEFCLVCGDPHSPHMHRVIYGSEGGKYELYNVVFLCYTHHNADGLQSVHSQKKKTQPLLLAHLAGDKRAAGKLRRFLGSV